MDNVLFAETRGVTLTPPMMTEDVHTKAEGTEVTCQKTTSSVTPANAGISIVLIAAVIGGVAGSIFVFVLVLLLALLCKYKRHNVSKVKCNDQPHQQSTQLEESEWMKTIHVQQLEGEGDQSIMMNNNCAYNTFEHQIPTVNNVAYGQIQSSCYRPNTAQYEYEYV